MKRSLAISLLGAACAMQPRIVHAATGSRIDVHHHFFPPALKDAAVQFARPDIYGSSPQLAEWLPQQSLQMMDRYGIRTALLSISTPGVSFGDPLAARTLARACNDYAVSLRQQYPGRYGLFAALPMPDIDASLREIHYAFDTLNADGIGLLTSYGTRWLGDPAFEPIIAELDRRGAVAFVHPTVGDCCRTLLPGVSPAVEEYPMDTTRAITSLIFSGTTVRYPNVRFIFAHGGGATGSLAARIARLAPASVLSRVPAGVLAEFRRLYFDIAIGASAGQLAGLLAFAASDHILFGTDVPFVAPAATIPDFEAYPFDRRERTAIEDGNALRLLAKRR